MERLYYSAKSYITHFQLYYCCWFAPVRVGLFIIGYFNLLVDVIYMVEVANDGLEPTILSVQNALIPDNLTKPVPVAAYAIEFAFNVVLLCGLYRRDITLLKVFMYYTIFAVILSFMTYSMILAAIALQIQLAIIFSTLFQMYCILLVRSEIVNMKIEKKKYELPQLVMSTVSSPTYNYPKNGYHEVTITELPKQQDVEIAMIDQGDEARDTKVYEFRREPKEVTKDVEIKKFEVTKTEPKTTEVKENLNDVEPKNETTIKLETAPQETMREVEVKVEIESKENIDEKSHEDKDRGTKLSKEEKKKEEKRIKEEKKKEEKRLKEEKKLDEKKNKDEKKDKQETSKDSKKEVRDKWLQSLTENPKE